MALCNMEGVVPALVDMLRNTGDGCKEAAVWALAKLALHGTLSCREQKCVGGASLLCF